MSREPSYHVIEATGRQELWEQLGGHLLVKGGLGADRCGQLAILAQLAAQWASAERPGLYTPVPTALW